MKSVTYDAESNMIIVSGGSEENPIIVQDIYDAAKDGRIPASVMGRDVLLEPGVGMQIGNESETQDRDILPDRPALDGTHIFAG